MLVSALSGQRLRIVHLFIASFLINLLGMSLPLFSMAVFDRVIPHAAFETLWALALGVSLALALEMLLRHARMKLMDAVGFASSMSFQGRLMSRLLFARTSDLPKSAGGVVPAAQELDQSAHLAPQLLISLAVDLPFFLLMMLFIGMIGGSVVIVPLIGTMVLILLHAVTHMLARKGFREQVGQSRRQMQHLIDAITGAERVRITNAGETLISSWEATADKAGYAAHLGRHWQGLAAQGGAVIVQAVVVGTVVTGTYRVQDAAMTIGALSATILLVNRAMMPISMLAGLIFRALQLGESLAQAAPLMQAGIERAGDTTGAPVQTTFGQIKMHNVTFAYAGETRASLRDVSLTIRPQERVGIIGKAGCGKSTLLRLIARLHEPTEGRVLLDERDIRHYDPVTLRNAIALMPQEAALLDLSLYENLTIGLEPVAQDQFERVVRLTGVHDFASVHPSGYGLAVGPGGQRLSGGERQAVSLARAMMSRPKLLLLDEPTAAMDNGAEMRFVSELKKQDMASFGLVIATHRLPALALVDRIIWLDQGRVVADGPKDQIFAKLGVAA
jgi:ATP-binding cassette subfamily C protein LapB